MMDKLWLHCEQSYYKIHNVDESVYYSFCQHAVQIQHSVRLLKGKVTPEVRKELKVWCGQLKDRHRVHSPIVIGSGGNINRLYKLAGGVGKRPIVKADLERTLDQLKAATYEEKLDRFGLKPDRADVIVPACRIYLDAMDLFDADTVIVPKVGLGDGMVLQLHRENQS